MELLQEVLVVQQRVQLQHETTHNSGELIHTPHTNTRTHKQWKHTSESVVLKSFCDFIIKAKPNTKLTNL